MKIFLFFLLLFKDSKWNSQIFSFAQITNLTLQFKNPVSKLYSLSPLYLSPNTFLKPYLTIKDSTFYKIPISIIRGYIRPLKIYNSKFTLCKTPIYFTQDTQSKFFTRSNYSNNIINIKKIEYRDCFSLSSDGGCIHLSYCKAIIEMCNFIQNTAKQIRKICNFILCQLKLATTNG